MDLSERTIDLLENNEITRGIIKRLLDAQDHRHIRIEGKDAKVGTGSVLRFDDYSDEEVHSIARELCEEGILEFQINITLPVYLLFKRRKNSV